MNSAKSRFGFTLVEILISIALFSVVIVVSSLAIANLGQFFEKIEQKDKNDVENYMTLHAVTNAISATVSYEVKSGGGFGFYFLGREDGFTGVTESPVFNSSPLAVYRFFREVNKDGSFSFYYEEAALNSPLISESQEHEFNFRTLFIGDIKEYSIKYVGFESYEKKFESELSSYVSVSEFDGILLKMQPVSVRLILDESLVSFSFSDRTDVLIGVRKQNEDDT